MSLNFPTAFWKDSTEVDDGVIEIDWSFNLYYSGDGIANVGTTRNFPFIEYNTYSDAWESFHPEYWHIGTNTTPDEDDAYWGWFLHGNSEFPTNGYHRASPFIINDNDTVPNGELNFYFEADVDTCEVLQRDDLYPDSGHLNYQEQFNKFIQSGSAVGTFTLNSPKTLQVKVSGLGERIYQATIHDRMHLGIDSTHLCKGEAPADWTANDYYDWDMNQVKLFNSAGTQTPNPAPDRNFVFGEAGSQFVDQDSRRFGYTTTAGQGTFTSASLSAGEHQIKIYFNSNDGIYNSGAFFF